MISVSVWDGQEVDRMGGLSTGVFSTSGIDEDRHRRDVGPLASPHGGPWMKAHRRTCCRTNHFGMTGIHGVKVHMLVRARLRTAKCAKETNRVQTTVVLSGLKRPASLEATSGNCTQICMYQRHISQSAKKSHVRALICYKPSNFLRGSDLLHLSPEIVSHVRCGGAVGTDSSLLAILDHVHRKASLIPVTKETGY